ncbi:MAG: response regulator, partial [Paracoccaceae bacterium]
EHIDLLITDVVMPGTLQGPALAKEIRSINPDLPCIFLSGYASEATVHGNGLKPSDIRLMKPVSRDDLLNAVLQAMSSDKSRIEPSEDWDHLPKS